MVPCMRVLMPPTDNYHLAKFISRPHVTKPEALSRTQLPVEHHSTIFFQAVPPSLPRFSLHFLTSCRGNRAENRHPTEMENLFSYLNSSNAVN